MMIIIYDRNHIHRAAYVRVATRRRVHLNNRSAAAYGVIVASNMMNDIQDLHPADHGPD